MPKRKSKVQDDLTKELGVLAKQLGNTIKAAAQSKEVKNIGSEISSSVRAISHSVVDAAKKAVKSEAAHSIKGQAKKVVVIGKDKAKKVIITGKDKGLHATKNWRSILSKELKAAGKELEVLSWRLKKM